MCQRCNIEIEYDEINGAVRRLKEGKSSVINEVAVEYLKRSRECGLE